MNLFTILRTYSPSTAPNSTNWKLTQTKVSIIKLNFELQFENIFKVIIFTLSSSMKVHKGSINVSPFKVQTAFPISFYKEKMCTVLKIITVCSIYCNTFSILRRNNCNINKLHLNFHEHTIYMEIKNKWTKGTWLLMSYKQEVKIWPVLIA